MADVYIDRLILEMPGGTPADGQRLAQEVGRLLTRGNAPAAGSRESMQVQIAAEPDGHLGRTAARVAAELLRQLA